VKTGDLIKHKRSALTAIIVGTYEAKNVRPKGAQFAEVLFSDSQRLSIASLEILKDNWEVISET
jgi:hypothetical protein